MSKVSQKAKNSLNSINLSNTPQALFEGGTNNIASGIGKMFAPFLGVAQVVAGTAQTTIGAGKAVLEGAKVGLEVGKKLGKETVKQAKKHPVKAFMLATALVGSSLMFSPAGPVILGAALTPKFVGATLSAGLALYSAKKYYDRRKAQNEHETSGAEKHQTQVTQVTQMKYQEQIQLYQE